MNTTANCACLWTRRTDRKTPKFDTVIVDLQLGDKCGLILDTMGLFRIEPNGGDVWDKRQ
jgi:hypothetical protein